MSGNEILYGFFFVFSSLASPLFGDSCGHSVLGPESGVLSSKNYPGTYPNNTSCLVNIRVPEGKGIILKFADLDIETNDCESDYIKILRPPYGDDVVYRPPCRSLRTPPRDPVHIDADEIIVEFRSGVHVSGRGFLLSYATGEHDDLLTCLDKGSHFSTSRYTKYCPAGCRAVAGDISGDVTQGYRHTSVLCKAAVHAGVIQDEVGGAVSVEEHKGCSHYVAARANGIQSKDGSLSDTLFTFVTDDLKKQIVLHPVSVNASSWCQTCLEKWRLYQWSPNGSHQDTRVRTWAPEPSDRRRWLQFDLGEKKKITGIVTTGSTVVDFDYYVRSYKIEFKERNRWKTFTRSNSSESMVFEGNVDSLHPVRNTLHPPIVTRFLRVLPNSWHQRIALRVELLGYPYIRENLSSEIISVETERPRSSPPREEEQVTEPVTSQADIVQLSIIVVSAVVGVLLVLVGIYLFKTLYKKKTKETPYGSTDAQEMGCWKQIQPFSRHQSTEFTISYSPEKDPVQKLDLVTSSMAEYQQPLMIGTGTVARKGSTFRPMDTETKDEPPPDSIPHYDYLHTANQYALPLTNQEPEYATPIIERHAFRKEPFLPDPSYSVPGAVPSKTPSFKATDCSGPRKPGGSFYQTPQVKKDRANNSEGVYDSPKASASPAHNVTSGEYQRPQAKPSVMETYSSPRDCVKAGNGTTRDPTV